MIPKFIAFVTALMLFMGVCLAADKTVNDDLLNDRVRIKLSSDAEVKGGALNVEVVQGVVTLSGSLETQHLKDKATKLAKKVTGVKQVINNITLKEHGAAK
jgi:osmotically-inducible protein OsmY